MPSKNVSKSAQKTAAAAAPAGEVENKVKKNKKSDEAFYGACQEMLRLYRKENPQAAQLHMKKDGLHALNAVSRLYLAQLTGFSQLVMDQKRQTTLSKKCVEMGIRLGSGHAFAESAIIRANEMRENFEKSSD